MRTALAGEAAIRAGLESLPGQPDQFAVLHPGFITTVKLADEDLCQSLQNLRVVRRVSEIDKFVWIFFQVEELTGVSGTVVDQFEPLIADHPRRARALTNLTVEPFAFLLAQHGSAFDATWNLNAGEIQ